MARSRCSRSIFALSLVWASQAAARPFDEVALIQRDTQLQPDAKDAAKPLVTLNQRRKNAITMMRAEVDKLMVGQYESERQDGPTDMGVSLDPAQILDMLPSLLDALRDDNFIRNFIQFEDGVERASENMVRRAHKNLLKLQKNFNETVALSRSGGEHVAAVRLEFSRFMDDWVNKVVVRFTEEMTEYAELFQGQVGGVHQLSKGFAELFVPLFKNATKKMTEKIHGMTGQSSFQETFANESEAKVCGLSAEIVYNASKTGKEAIHVLKILNSTRRMAVPMLGRYLDDTLPLDASEADKKVPERMMLVMNYEVSCLYSGLDALRKMMSDYGDGLKPVLAEMQCSERSAAASLFGLPRLAVLLAVAVAARFGL